METLPEYIVQVKTIIEKKTSKPILVLIDGKDISETCSKVSSAPYDSCGMANISQHKGKTGNAAGEGSDLDGEVC